MCCKAFPLGTGGEARADQSAIDSCISATGGGHPQEPWQRGVYSLRKGGSEFIEGKSPLPDDDSVPHSPTPFPPFNSKRHNRSLRADLDFAMQAG
jgi:hypothetical protein